MDVWFVALKKENFTAFLPSRNLKNMKKIGIFLLKNILEGFPNLIKLYNFVTRKNSIRIVTRGNKAPSIKYLHPWMVCFPPVN